MTKKQEESLVESIITLTKLVKQLRSEKYLQMIENRKKFLFYNFLSGISGGIGFVLGTTLVLGLILWILSQLITIPLFGDWLIKIINYIQENRLSY